MATHLAVKGKGLTECCGKSPMELPLDDKLTTDPSQVRCNRIDLPLTMNGKVIGTANVDPDTGRARCHITDEAALKYARTGAVMGISIRGEQVSLVTDPFKENNGKSS